MEQEKSFFRTVCNLAVPVALQSMLQASFSIIDQIMIGLAGIFTVLQDHCCFPFSLSLPGHTM
ncbi:MAG: hypothetical protein Q4C57_03180 [Bacillota bacterium]|nr:hypothetical protein [Bacillota bacterium]